MFVQRLIDYAGRIDILPKNYAEKAVNWLVELKGNGEWVGTGFVPVEKGHQKVVPFHERSGRALKPILLYDKAEYALGFFKENDMAKVVEGTQKKHGSFIALLEECVQTTGDPAVQAVLTALQKENRPPFPETMKANDWVLFRVDDQFPHEVPKVRDFWVKRGGGASKGKKQFTCIGCGELCVPAERHNIPIKLRGGHGKGTKLISANDNAYFSYNLKNSLIAPTCSDCAEKYGKALNHLLSQEHSHMCVGDLTYIVWTKSDHLFSPFALLSQPDPESVLKLFKKVYTASPTMHVHASEFYCAALSPYISRVVVRDWVETTIDTVQANLANWFNNQKMIDRGVEKYHGIYALAASVYRDANKELRPNVPLYLLQHAMHRKPLPHTLLVQAVRRCVAERRVTAARAALLKLYFLQKKTYKEDELMELDPNRTEPAYLCGRLFAHLEYIQLQAVNPNATLVDRYYGTASTAPTSVFGYLVRNAQNHLAKVRKERYGQYVNLNKELQAILQGLTQFPKLLNSEEQGLFAIGFYHQRHSYYVKKESDQQGQTKQEEQNEAKGENN